MDESLIQRLENSFKPIAFRAPELADHFFAHLFSKNPPLRSLFPRDMTQQKQEFLSSFMLVVQNLHKRESLHKLLIDLGRRHAGVQARLAYYPVVRETLIGVMRDMVGPQWSEQLTHDWADALNYVVAGMIVEQRQEHKTPAALTTK